MIRNQLKLIFLELQVNMFGHVPLWKSGLPIKSVPVYSNKFR